MRPGIIPPGLLLFWPYLLAALVVGFWFLLLRKRIARKLEYAFLAFAVCTLANLAIEEACAYLVPLDIAGTPPPDPRNAAVRFLITLAIQVPVTLVAAYYLAARTRVDRWQRP